MSTREAWTVVVQNADGEQETELATLTGGHLHPGATLELTDGTRITCVEPAGESQSRNLEAA